MKRTRKAKPTLAPPVLALVKMLVNKTPDGSVGYDEAAGMVSELWDQFDAAGATVADMENICGFIRWAKWEGFCEASPLA